MVITDRCKYLFRNSAVVLQAPLGIPGHSGMLVFPVVPSLLPKYITEV